MSRSSRAVFLSILICLFAPAYAASEAEDELGNWLIYNGTLRFSERWSLFTETQLRFWELASNPQEFFLRGIGQYHMSDTLTFGFGYTWVKTEPFEDEKPEETENRLIEQASVKQFWNTSVAEHRFRLEQRWLQPDGGDTRYENRFRYRLQVTTPLGKAKIGAKTHFLNFYNELFVKFGNVDKNFDQNRLYGAYGWQFDTLSNLQLGLLWQHRADSLDYGRLQIFYTRNFDFRN